MVAACGQSRCPVIGQLHHHLQLYGEWPRFVCVCADVILWSVAGIQCLTTFDIAMNEWYGFKGKKNCL